MISTDEELLKQQLEAMRVAARQRDLEQIMLLYSSRAQAFEFGLEHDYAGIRNYCEAGYKGILSDFTYSFAVTRILISEGLALVTGVESVSGRTAAGFFSQAVNATYVFEKEAGTWLIVHQHLSNHAEH